MGVSTKKFQQDYRVWRMGFLLLLIVSESVSLLGQSAPVLRSTSNRTEREGKARSGVLEATIRSDRAAAEPKLKSEKEKEVSLKKEEALKKEESQKARKAALKAWRERLKRPINGFIFEPDSMVSRQDSFAILRFTKGVRFLDSLKGGKLDSLTAQISRIDFGNKVKYNYRDPFDPYNNKVFYRHGQGKFWFFGLGVILLGVIMYFRAAYPKQFELRIKGIFNGYYFNELVNDRTVTQYSGGSGVVFVLSQAVFSSGAILYMISGGYLHLNNFWFFLLFYMALLGGVIGLQAIQFLFASSVHMESALRRFIQRQYNINFVLALIFFPLFLITYYNGYKFDGVPLADWVSFMLVLWIVIRSIFSFVGLFQDRQLNFLTFLYFCTLEILPYTVLFASISRI
ncbi:MAG: hypothetical protein CK543_05880 [Flavobacteriales bacterium]|nr:MAG: hypothetical protein CK543_05880 [Flavobacteriales bacterium]